MASAYTEILKMYNGKSFDETSSIAHLLKERAAISKISQSGRSERIRTSDPCLPKTVLYQAELHSDRAARDSG